MTEHHARTAALARLRQELEVPPFHRVLRPRAVDADPDKGIVIVGIDFRDELRRLPNDHAYHGGVIATLIDLTGHAAVAVKIGQMAPTIDLRIDYLRPADNSSLIATAKLISAGKSVARVDVEIVDDRGRSIAIGRGTYSTRQHGTNAAAASPD
jgi:uncharacterized protein (TIGR00369 family)